MDKKLAVITVNFNNYSLTEDFLSYFDKQTNSNFKIFISDLSTKKKVIKNRPSIEVIIDENKGYAHGVNLGLKTAQSQGFNYFIIINNDTRVDRDFIQKCQISYEKFPHSLTGGKIYYEKGFEYHKKYHVYQLGKIIWYAGGIIDWDNVFTKHRGVDEVDHGQFNKMEKTDFITGCLMLFDKQVLQTVGYWDEKYFLYYEDADYCMKATKKGVGLIYNPSITIWHKNAQSTGGAGSKIHQRYQERNRLRFGLKYAPLKTKLHLLKNYFFNQL